MHISGYIVQLKTAFSSLATGLSAALLAGCAPTPGSLANQKVATAEECVVGKCRFHNAPLQLHPDTVRIRGRLYDFNRLAAPLQFTDGTGKDWEAPETTLTDGASIPPIFVPIIGFPREPEFEKAAALHDAYCGIGNEDGPVYHAKTWQEVHRLLYDALVADGTPTLKAKIMFAAVWLGGPRWYPNGRTDSTLENLSPVTKQAAMIKAIAYIRLKKPEMQRLVEYLTMLEHEMLRSGRDEDRNLRGQDDPNNPTTPQ
jgi:hypothetical protein